MLIHISVLFTILTKIEAAKILTVAPHPSWSHQIIYRPIHDELIKRGHEVTFITANPAYSVENAPKNLKEINVGPESRKMWTNISSDYVNIFQKDLFSQSINTFTFNCPKVLEMQLSLEKVKEVIENNHYDLLILQGWFRALMALSHVHKVPVVKVSPMTMTYDNPLTVGAPNHVLYYPNFFKHRLHNLTWWEQIAEVYNNFLFEYKYYNYEEYENGMLRQFYPDMPDLDVLNNNLDMLYLNVHPLWDMNRPLPPNTIYFGFASRKQSQPLPKDIEQYMESSKNGVIYMSFGTNLPASMLPPHIKNMFLKVFSELPYDILWKFDADLPDCPRNVKISKWFPQSDIFGHPNLKLIITQGGLHTSEEAINVAVPVLCIPFLGDQWLNCENFVHYGAGVKLDKHTMTEEEFKEAITTVITDTGYRSQMSRLRGLVLDQRVAPLQRAVRWLELAARHGGRHLRSPAANLPAHRYYELELLAIIAATALAAISLLTFILYYFTKKLLQISSQN